MAAVANGRPSGLRNVDVVHPGKVKPMKLRVGYELVYRVCAAHADAADAQHALLARAGRDRARPHRHRSARPARQYRDSFGNLCTRLTAPAGILRCRTSALLRRAAAVRAARARRLPASDRGTPRRVHACSCSAAATARPTCSPTTAWQLFGHDPLGCARVQAICDFVHQPHPFDYNHARPTKTAWEAYDERAGVCRDYAHLAVTLCRAMNIPARYCTGYISDVGLPRRTRRWTSPPGSRRTSAIVAHLRSAQQRAAHRTRPDGARPRCRRRRDQQHLRYVDPDPFPGGVRTGLVIPLALGSGVYAV